MSSTMVSPVRGYVTSEYGSRSGTLHAGIDIATGGVAAPVYAAFAGTITHIVRGRKRYQPASVGETVAPYRTGDGCRVRNPDGEQQVYIHMRPLSKWRNGDHVRQGELLGYVNLSGNTSGYHLHFEVWSAIGRTRNPRIDFRAFDITPGSTPKALPPEKKYPDVGVGANPTWDELFDALDLVVRGAGMDGGRDTRAERIQHWLLREGYLEQANGKPGIIDGKWGVQSWKAVQRRLRHRDRKPYLGPIDGKAPRSGETGTTWNCTAAFCNDRRGTARRAT